MTARSGKKVPKRQINDIKTTVVIVLFVVVAVQGFFLFQKNKQPEPDAKPAPTYVPIPQAVKPAPAKRPKPMPAPVAAKPVAASKKAQSADSQRRVPGTAGKIAFIIDDWGYNMRNCRILSEIKAPLAIAILPNLIHSNDIGVCAKQAGKDIMLHLPLEPHNNPDHYPDNYLITVSMGPSQVASILEDTLKKMPYVEGVNNHIGSKATENMPLMLFVFKYLRKHGLFFVDSLTSPNSICSVAATQAGIPFAQRDVFLDNENTRESIAKQFSELARTARQKGHAIAIGHDRALTMQMIKEEIPNLKAQGFEIVSIKELLKK